VFAAEKTEWTYQQQRLLQQLPFNTHEHRQTHTPTCTPELCMRARAPAFMRKSATCMCAHTPRPPPHTHTYTKLHNLQPLLQHLTPRQDVPGGHIAPRPHHPEAGSPQPSDAAAPRVRSEGLLVRAEAAVLLQDQPTARAAAAARVRAG
jgi:hypothetical protein